jgi:hypothetical protein
MSTRAKLLVAGGLGGVGLLAIIIALFSIGGVRGYLADNYKRVSGSGESIVYTSASKPKTVYEDLRDAQPPADTQVDPRGYYLRYADDIVAITSSGTGSRIYIDDERRGYVHWLPIVGGFWGTYGGSGEGFRGGGPGGGK